MTFVSMTEPLDPPAARILVRDILACGRVVVTGHAKSELAKDEMTMVDVANVPRGGRLCPGERENGSWRYRIRTSLMCVVIAFRSECELVVVTGWRLNR